MTQEEMAMKLTEEEARSKSNSHRIEEMEKRIDTMNRVATAMEVMANEQRHQAEKIDDIKASVTRLEEKVGTIEQKPAKRWDGLKEKVISTAVSTIVAAIVAALLVLAGGGA